MKELELLFGVFITLIGLSHFLLPREWALLFNDLEGKAYAAPLIGVITLISGIPIVLFHNVWAFDFRVFTTLLGWAWTIKSLKYMTIKNSYKYTYRPSKSEKEFIAVGIFMIFYGVLMAVPYFTS